MLQTAGTGAEQIVQLFWWMSSAAGAIWLLVMALAMYAMRVNPKPHDENSSRLLILGGGIVFPTVALTVLLAYGLQLMPKLTAPGDGLSIAVSGEQWWWRVRYQPGGREPIDSANEIRLPLGERVEFQLSSPDVIHSFWIPALGGKIDMIPGRENRLVLEPSKIGRYRGVCAEFCGLSHAFMAFPVVVMEPQAFAEWLERQAGPAEPPAETRAARGQRLFLNNGCGACHRIRGTPANGVIGPDLTHVGGRLSLAAGSLPMTGPALSDWIDRSTILKPGAHMPSYGMLDNDQRDAISHYLLGLK